MFRLACVVLLLLFANELAAQATGSKSILPDETPANRPEGRHTRTLFSIVWMCFSMTIICAWTVVHPNIPPRERRLKRILRRLELMIWTIVAPEILPCWALNQMLAAMTVRDEYNKARDYKEETWGETMKRWVSNGIWKTFSSTMKKWASWDEIIPSDESGKWTLRHGHFLIMGGFHLVVEGGSVSMPADATTPLERDKPLSDSPTETKADVENTAGKPKILTLELFKPLLAENPKLKIQITEDEIADRSKGDALAKFIFIAQTSWFITECIARGVQGLYFTQLELTTLALASLNGVTLALWWYKPLGAQTPVCLYLKKLPQSNAVTQQTKSYRRELISDINHAFHPDGFKPFNWFIRHSWFTVSCLLSPLIILSLVCRATIMDLLRTPSLTDGATHVPTFYVPAHERKGFEYVHFLVLMILGSIFGGIHCAGWSLPFPTYTEQKLWHAASLALTISPICAIPIIYIALYFSCLTNLLTYKKLIPLEITAGICVAARLILLAQALALLRDQPPSAFIAVDWTRFYPRFL